MLGGDMGGERSLEESFLLSIGHMRGRRVAKKGNSRKEDLWMMVVVSKTV